MQMQYGHPELVETRSDGVKRVYSMNLRKDGLSLLYVLLVFVHYLFDLLIAQLLVV